MKNDVRYNPIGGKTIEVGDNNTDYTSGGWLAGVDDSAGYIIVGDTTILNLVGSGTGGGLGDPIGSNMPVFYQSTGRTDNALLDLLNKIPYSPGGFDNVQTALTWLDTTPYSLAGYGSTPPLQNTILGDYYLLANYSPAVISGSITFPNHEIHTYDLNPNHIGQFSPGSYATQIYINKFGFANEDNSSALNSWINKSGVVKLTQGSNSVTFSFTNQSFENTNYGFNVYADNVFENSVFGSITILAPASSDFNTTQPIQISYTLNP